MHCISSNKDKSETKQRESELKLPEVRITDQKTASNKKFQAPLGSHRIPGSHLDLPSPRGPSNPSLYLISPWGPCRALSAKGKNSSGKKKPILLVGCPFLSHKHQICCLCGACVGFGPSGWLLFLLLGPEPCAPLQPRQSLLSILNTRIPAELFSLGTAQGKEARSQSGAEVHRAGRKDPFPTASAFSSALRAAVPFAESSLGRQLTKGDLHAHSPHSKISGLEQPFQGIPITHHKPV